MSDNPKLHRDVKHSIDGTGNETFVSVVSLWEVALKARLGKIGIDPRDVIEAVEPSGFSRLGVEDDHLIVLGGLQRVPGHRDPFDHLLVAQARAESATLVTADRKLDAYAIATLPV